jgi:hypothetical protein
VPKDKSKKNAVKVDKSIEQWLKGAEKKFAEEAEKAKEEGFGERPEVDDGKYNGRLKSWVLENSAKGAKQAHAELELLDGNFAGTTVHKYDGLEGERSWEFMCKTLGKVGVDPTEVKARNLPGILGELAEGEPVFKLQLKTGDSGYQNIFINGVVEDYEEEDDDTDDEEEDDEEEFELEPGDEVSFKDGKKTLEGEVVKINEKKQTVDIKVGKKKYTVSFDDIVIPEKEDEDDDEEDEEESSEFAVGQKVAFKDGKKAVEGEITAVDEDEEEATVKVGKKKHTVSFDKLSLIEEDDTDEDEEEDEEEDEPVKTPKKKSKK